jgi:hypothetical protein
MTKGWGIADIQVKVELGTVGKINDAFIAHAEKRRLSCRPLLGYFVPCRYRELHRNGMPGENPRPCAIGAAVGPEFLG